MSTTLLVVALGSACGAVVEPGRNVIVTVDQSPLEANGLTFDSLSIFVSSVSLSPCDPDDSQAIASDPAATFAHGTAADFQIPQATLRWVSLVGAERSPVAALSTPPSRYCRAQLSVFPGDGGASLRGTFGGDAIASLSSTLAFDIETAIDDPFETVDVGAFAFGDQGRSVSLRIAIDEPMFGEKMASVRDDDDTSATVAAALASSLRLTLERSKPKSEV